MEYNKSAKLYIDDNSWAEICFELSMIVDSPGNNAGFLAFMNDEKSTEYPLWIYILTDIKRPAVLEYAELEPALTGGSYSSDIREAPPEIEHRLQWIFEQILYPDYLRWRGFNIDEMVAKSRSKNCAEYLYDWCTSDDLQKMIGTLWCPVE